MLPKHRNTAQEKLKHKQGSKNKQNLQTVEMMNQNRRKREIEEEEVKK